MKSKNIYLSLIFLLISYLSYGQIEFTSDTSNRERPTREGRYTLKVFPNGKFGFMPKTGNVIFPTLPSSGTSIGGSTPTPTSSSIVLNNISEFSTTSSNSVIWDGSIWNRKTGTVVANNAIWILGSSGTYFERVIIEGVINAEWFGVNGFDEQDDLVATQSAINWCINNGYKKLFAGRGRLIWGSGTIGTLFIRPTGVGFVNFEYFGLTKTFFDLAATWIDHTAFGDRPCIAIDQARGVVVKNLALKGKNVAPSSIVDFRKDINNYISNGCSNGRYNANVGIVIDAYSSDPGVGNRYPVGTYYSNANSAEVYIQDVFAWNFVVGFGVKFAPDNNQGDTIEFLRCDVGDCAYGASINCHQARNVIWRGPSFMNRTHTLFTNRIHGPQTGSPPFIYNVTGGSCWQIVDLSFQMGQGKIADSHFEIIGAIGEVTADALNKKPFVIDNTLLSFAHGTNENPAYQLYTTTNTTIKNCDISFIGAYIDGTYTVPDQKLQLFNFISNEAITYENNRIGTTGSTGFPYIGITQSNKYKAIGIGINNVATQSGVLSLDQTFVNFGQSRLMLHPNSSFYSYRGDKYRIDFAPIAEFADGFRTTGGISNVNYSGENVSFTSINPERFIVGDVILWRVKRLINNNTLEQRVPVGYVSNKSNNTITITFYPKVDYDNTYVPTEIEIAVPLVIYNNIGGIKASTTAGSNQVILSSTSNVRVGDWFFLTNGANDGWFRVVTINNGTTITANKIIGVNTTNQNFYVAKFNKIVESVQGKAAFSGDGTTKTFLIPHNLGVVPTSISVEAGSSDAITGGYFIDEENTNDVYIGVTAINSISGTNNYKFYWSAK